MQRSQLKNHETKIYETSSVKNKQRVSEGSPMGDVWSVSSIMHDYSYYLRHDIWVNIYTVDSKWLYSLYWCMNVSSITTNRCHEFAAMTSPVWHLVSRVQALFFICDLLFCYGYMRNENISKLFQLLSTLSKVFYFSTWKFAWNVFQNSFRAWAWLAVSQSCCMYFCVVNLWDVWTAEMWKPEILALHFTKNWEELLM